MTIYVVYIFEEEGKIHFSNLYSFRFPGTYGALIYAVNHYCQ